MMTPKRTIESINQKLIFQSRTVKLANFSKTYNVKLALMESIIKALWKRVNSMDLRLRNPKIMNLLATMLWVREKEENSFPNSDFNTKELLNTINLMVLEL